MITIHYLALLLHRRRVRRPAAFQQRVVLLHPLLPLPLLLPRVVLPPEVGRQTGLADAARRGAGRRPRVAKPAPLALPEVHFAKADGARVKGPICGNCALQSRTCEIRG